MEIYIFRPLHIVDDHTNSKTKYTGDEIVNMINILTDNIFIEFWGRIFQQTVGMSMGTNCAPLLAIYFYTHTKPSLSNTFFVKEERN